MRSNNEQVVGVDRDELTTTGIGDPIMRVVRRGNILLWTLLAWGCIGEKAAIPSEQSPENALGSVTASPRVVILAVGATQPLSVSATSLTGVPITTFDSVRVLFNAVADTARVRVTNDGLLTALAPSAAPIILKSVAFRNGGVKGDLVLVQVTATAVSGATLSIQPVAPDSAKLAMGSTKTIVPIVRNPLTGVSVANPVIRYTVQPSDARRMRVYTPSISLTFNGGNLPIQDSPSPPSLTNNQIFADVGEGSTWIYATISAYGVVLQDSVQYGFSYPYTLTVSSLKTNLAVTNAVAGQVVTLAPGATVTFQNGVASADPLLIAYAFDNPAAATAVTPPSTVGGTAGNVAVLSGGQTSKRQFLAPGTYRWTATATGGPAPWPGQTLSGTILVK